MQDSGEVAQSQSLTASGQGIGKAGHGQSLTAFTGQSLTASTEPAHAAKPAMPATSAAKAAMPLLSFVVAPQTPSQDKDSIICFICGESFDSQGDLRAHEAVGHAGQFRCLTCGKSSFKSARDLRKHSRSTKHSISAGYKITTEKQAGAVFFRRH